MLQVFPFLLAAKETFTTRPEPWKSLLLLCALFSCRWTEPLQLRRHLHWSWCTSWNNISSQSLISYGKVSYFWLASPGQRNRAKLCHQCPKIEGPFHLSDLSQPHGTQIWRHKSTHRALGRRAQAESQVKRNFLRYELYSPNSFLVTYTIFFYFTANLLSN